MVKFDSSGNSDEKRPRRPIIYICTVALVPAMFALWFTGSNLSSKSIDNVTNISKPAVLPLITEGKSKNQSIASENQAGLKVFSAKINAGIQKVKNNPACKIIYFSEILPDIDESIVLRCERVLARRLEDQLKEEYITQICANPNQTQFSRMQIADIQARLRAYSLIFPQSGIRLNEKDIDGLFGTDTCHSVASYQYETHYPAVTGEIDQMLYQNLVGTIPLDEKQMRMIARKYSKPVKIRSAPGRDVVADFHPDVVTIELPANPFRQFVFCVHYPEFAACKARQKTIQLARLDRIK